MSARSTVTKLDQNRFPRCFIAYIATQAASESGYGVLAHGPRPSFLGSQSSIAAQNHESLQGVSGLSTELPSNSILPPMGGVRIGNAGWQFWARMWRVRLASCISAGHVRDRGISRSSWDFCKKKTGLQVPGRYCTPVLKCVNRMQVPLDIPIQLTRYQKSKRLNSLDATENLTRT
jgi:hypothetical protein